MGVYEATVALLPDGPRRRVFLDLEKTPDLGVVVLGCAGNQTEVFAGDLVSVYKPAAAQLLDSVRTGVIASWNHHPPLRGVVLPWAGDETEILGGVSWASRNRPLLTCLTAKTNPADANSQRWVSLFWAVRVTRRKSLPAISWASRNRPLLFWRMVAVAGNAGRPATTDLIVANGSTAFLRPGGFSCFIHKFSLCLEWLGTTPGWAGPCAHAVAVRRGNGLAYSPHR